MIKNPKRLEIKPNFKKSLEVRYRIPNSSSKFTAVWLGNEETGKPIPFEQINVVRKIKSLAWLTFIELPISKAIGINKTLATVWLINVEIIKTSNPKIIAIGHNVNPFKVLSIKTSISFNNPDDKTDFPNPIPLIAKNTIDHGKLSKSDFLNSPVPKKIIMGSRAMTPISPKNP